MKRLYKMSDLGSLLKAGGPYIGPRGGKYADPQHKIPWNDKPFDPPKRVKGCDTCGGLGHRIGKQSRIDGKADAVSAPCPTCNPKGSFPLNRGEVKRRGLPQPLPTEGEKKRAGSKEKKRARDARYRKRKKVKKVQAEKQTTLALAVRPGDLAKAGGPYIGPRGGKYADPQHKIPWKEGTPELSISEQPGKGFSVKLKVEGVLAGVLVVNEPKELSPEARRAVPPGGHPVSVAWVNVNDEHKRKGHGKALYAAAVREARKRGLVLVRADHAGSTIEPAAKKLWGDAIVKARKLHYRTKFRGLDISIENQKGSYRYWRGGRTKMQYPYGYVRGTEGTDGDHLDVYLGPNEDAAYAYVIDQGKKGNWGEFDEQKVMLGFDSAAAAKNAYLDHYNDPRFFQSMQAIPMDLFLETVTDPNNRGKRIQKGGKYIKRVPYVDGKGRKRYRYYYSQSAVARDVAAGEVVRLGKRMVQILDVDGDTGAITIKVGKGKARKVTPGEWGKLVSRHHGSHYRRWAERRARSVIDAVQRHVPKKLLEDLEGATDKERLADLQKKAPEVYEKLRKSFARAGMSVHSAKRVIARVMERRGWDSDARALAIGSVIKKDTGSGEIDQLIRASENLSDGWGVKAGDVATAVRMRKGDLKERTDRLAARAEKERSKLEEAMEKAKHGSIKDVADVLAQSLDASAMHQLVQMLQAHPGLKMDEVEASRKALLEVPSVAPAKAPKQVGSETVLFVSEMGQAKALKARYRLMEAKDVIASHDPAKGFKKRDDYPEGVQERAYHKDRAEQQKVVGNAMKLKPAIVVNTNPDAVNGPPMVTPDGHALGGNSRTMSMQKAYADHPEKAAELREYLKKNAHQFGLTEADVDAMENPILVREMIPPDDKGYSKEEMQLLVRQMNESFTQAMDPRTMQVALGRKLKQDTLDTLAADMEEGETLNKFLDSSRSDDFLKKLERDGVIDSRNANQYRKRLSGGKLGRLNEDGKTLVSRILVGRIVGDADTLSNTAPSVIKSVAMVTPALSRAAKKGKDYDLGSALSLALEARSRIAARGNVKLQGGIDDQTFRRAVGELDDMFDPHPIVKDPLATKVLEVLLKRPGSRQLPETFNRYADLVSRESDENQGGLLGIHESRSALDLLTRALKESPADTKKSFRFGVPLSVLRKADDGGGWETGPRGGLRRRKGNGWEYKGRSSEEKKQLRQELEKERAEREAKQKLDARKEAYFQSIRHGRIAGDIASAEEEAGKIKVEDLPARVAELKKIPPDQLDAKMKEMGLPDPTKKLRAIQLIMGEKYYENMPPEVQKKTGAKTAGEMISKVQAPKSKKAKKKAVQKTTEKASELSEALKKRGQTDMSEATLVLARGLVKLATQKAPPKKEKSTISSVLEALAKLVNAGLGMVATAVGVPLIGFRADAGETPEEGAKVERQKAQERQGKG